MVLISEFLEQPFDWGGIEMSFLPEAIATIYLLLLFQIVVISFIDLLFDIFVKGNVIRCTQCITSLSHEEGLMNILLCVDPFPCGV